MMQTLRITVRPRLMASLAVFCVLCLVSFPREAVPAVAQINEDLGSYDPEGTFSDRRDLGIEHIFMPWEDVELDSLFAADQYSGARNRTLLVTVEPWTWSRDERNTAEHLRNNVTRGTYDPNIRAICSRLDDLNVPVIMRWGHEMDNSEGQFIWSGWEPQAYIDAYRHVISTCRASAPDVRFMWSPLGEENMADYYPGDDVVDIVGLTVFGLQSYDNDKFSRDRRLNEILQPRYDRAVEFGKPVCVAELGYLGNEDYLTQWQTDVRASFGQFPELECVVYFNQQEVYPWPDGYGLPDWRIEEQYF